MVTGSSLLARPLLGTNWMLAVNSKQRGVVELKWLKAKAARSASILGTFGLGFRVYNATKTGHSVGGPFSFRSR